MLKPTIVKPYYLRSDHDIVPNILQKQITEGVILSTITKYCPIALLLTYNFIRYNQGHKDIIIFILFIITLINFNENKRV